MPTNLKVDEDLLAFAREQLTMQVVKSMNRPTARLRIANGDIMPVVTLEGYEWENEIQIVEFDSYGIAVVLADKANDGGNVGIIARRQRYPIKTISDFTEISWLSIQQSRAKGLPLEQRYADALVAGIDKKINSIGYDGDIDYGLSGIFTSQLPRMTAASTFAAAANADAKLAILNSAVSACIANSNSIYVPKILAMPEPQHQDLANSYRASGSDLTILQSFLDTQGALGQIERIVVDNTLKGKGEGGTDAMLVLPYDGAPQGYQGTETPGSDWSAYPICFVIAREFDIPEEFMQWDDTVYKERAVARVVGVVAQEPLTGLIVSGI